MKKIALIGSTGSIGRQVLSVVDKHSDKFSVVSISAGGNATLFSEQVKKYKPKVATLVNPIDTDGFKGTEFFFGENSFKNAIIDEADVAVISLVGFNGIIAVLEAINKGKNIALANKESLVVGGELVMRLAKEKGVSITPIDSEHSAIWQALSFDFNKPFNKIIITASGGAFRDLSYEEMKTAKAVDALKHPNWLMGKKITIDCATLVNKAFEVIEAKWLYNTTFDKIDVIIHRESIIHSMVEFMDSSVIAQLSYPTMEIPIALSLSYPDRLDIGIKKLDFKELNKLTFSPVSCEKYPCFNEVVSAGKKGGLSTAVVNGANEVAVDLYLKDKIPFFAIYDGIKGALDGYKGTYDGTYQSLKDANDFGARFVKEKYGEIN